MNTPSCRPALRRPSASRIAAIVAAVAPVASSVIACGSETAPSFQDEVRGCIGEVRVAAYNQVKDTDEPICPVLTQSDPLGTINSCMSGRGRVRCVILTSVADKKDAYAPRTLSPSQLEGACSTEQKVVVHCEGADGEADGEMLLH